jgi:hypothetical protein
MEWDDSVDTSFKWSAGCVSFKSVVMLGNIATGNGLKGQFPLGATTILDIVSRRVRGVMFCTHDRMAIQASNLCRVYGIAAYATRPVCKILISFCDSNTTFKNADGGY